jgi:hypothetical protein
VERVFDGHCRLIFDFQSCDVLLWVLWEFGVGR